MRKTTSPTPDQWKELFQEADRFRLKKPWLLLDETDLIAVENPNTREIGYCSVMGRGGTHYALGVYLGDPGLIGFDRVANADEPMTPDELLHVQDCIMVSFENRDELFPQERNLIKELGLTYRGKNAWPSFRRYEPGYYPWDINAEECEFLTHALRQLMAVIEELGEGKVHIDLTNGMTVLRSSRKENGLLAWTSRPYRLEMHHPALQLVLYQDELMAERVKRARRLKSVTLQVDTVYAPTPVQDKKGQRPFFPRIVLVADQKSGQMIGFQMYREIREDAKMMTAQIVKYCSEQGRPALIQVCSGKALFALKDFCAKCDIPIKQIDRLISIDRFLQSMPDF